MLLEVYMLDGQQLLTIGVNVQVDHQANKETESNHDRNTFSQEGLCGHSIKEGTHVKLMSGYALK